MSRFRFLVNLNINIPYWLNNLNVDEISQISYMATYIYANTNHAIDIIIFSTNINIIFY
jgi:hypothetical protein